MNLLRVGISAAYMLTSSQRREMEAADKRTSTKCSARYKTRVIMTPLSLCMTGGARVISSNLFTCTSRVVHWLETQGSRKRKRFLHAVCWLVFSLMLLYGAMPFMKGRARTHKRNYPQIASPRRGTLLPNSKKDARRSTQVFAWSRFSSTRFAP